MLFVTMDLNIVIPQTKFLSPKWSPENISAEVFYAIAI